MVILGVSRGIFIISMVLRNICFGGFRSSISGILEILKVFELF